MKHVVLLLLMLPSLAFATCVGFVRLTFDDGPSLYTSRVLDVLQQHDVKATFFVIGEKISNNREQLIRIVKEGHRVGNHTWSHPDLTKLTTEARVEELRKTSAAIKDTVGFLPVEWRPPFELWNQDLQKEAATLGMIMTLWTYGTDSEDWKGHSADTIIEKLTSNMSHGSIILMHDTQENSLSALSRVITGVKEKNLCFAN